MRGSVCINGHVSSPVCRFFFIEWPVVIGGEWRYYEQKKGRKTHIIFVDYFYHGATNYHLMASKSELRVVAETVVLLLNHIYSNYTRLYNLKHANNEAGMLSYGSYMKERVHGAGQSLGAQILAYVSHHMLNRNHRQGTSAGKLGVIYGLDAAGVEFSKRGAHNPKPTDFFHLDRKYAHRVVLLITDTMESGSKHAEGHYNYHVNGPIGGVVGFQAQPGCMLKGQRPSSCSHQRAMNLFRASLRDHRDTDHLMTGFEYERDENIPVIGHPKKYPHISGIFKLNRDKTSVYGINNDYGNAFPKADERHIYFLPTALCSPFNHIENKMDMELPETCTEYIDNQYATMEPFIEMKFYQFSSWKVGAAAKSESMTSPSAEPSKDLNEAASPAPVPPTLDVANV